MRPLILGLALLPLTLSAPPTQAQTAPAATVQKHTGILPSTEVETLVPATVYFRGKTAPVQLRNAAAIRFDDDAIFFAALVDTSGYSSNVRERYQFYLVTETALDIAGKHLAAGAYGCGFLDDGSFIVMDLGGNDVLSAPTTKDATLRRPRPLQILPSDTPKEFRLFLGRQYIALKRASK
jgi:hypothetical protein